MATPNINLIGRRFGHLKVVSFSKESGEKQGKWICQCSCGNTVRYCTSGLLRGIRKSCGHAHYIDLSGKRFGHLLVLERAPNIPDRPLTRYWCKCDCGNKYIMTYQQLIYQGKTTCGGCE